MGGAAISIAPAAPVPVPVAVVFDGKQEVPMILESTRSAGVAFVVCASHVETFCEESTVEPGRLPCRLAAASSSSRVAC